MAGARIIDTGEPEASTVAFDGNVLVHENWGATRGQGAGNDLGVKGDVMIAEDGIALRGGKGGEDFGAAVDGVASGCEGERAVGDEVSREQD